MSCKLCGSFTQAFFSVPTRNWTASEFAGIGFLILIVSLAWARFVNRIV